MGRPIGGATTAPTLTGGYPNMPMGYAQHWSLGVQRQLPSQSVLEVNYVGNPKTVAVIMSCGPVSVKWASGNLPAMLAAWYPGEEAGTALAKVLFGEYNPAGRLPYTVYDSVDQIPPQDEYDITKGITYMYFTGHPQFAFGHGLSYTAFRYTGLKITPAQISADGKVTVSLEVQNVGTRAGDEAADLAFYDVRTKKFVVEPGVFDIMVGSTSDDIRMKYKLQVGSRRTREYFGISPTCAGSTLVECLPNSSRSRTLSTGLSN